MRNHRCSSYAQILIVAGVLILAPAAASGQPLRPAVIDRGGGLTWEPTVEYERATMIVSRPDGTTFQREYSVQAPLWFDLADPEGQTLQNGSHRYELLLFRTLRPEEWESHGRVYQLGHDIEVVVERTIGFFAIKNGILAGGEAVGENELRPLRNEILAGGEVVGGSEPLQLLGVSDSDSGTTRDQVILDDLIVDGSACIGMDCVNGESFGFDTIRIKENNLRIRAVDTSNSASFPSNDWQITFNDSANGGANKFSIDDIDGGRTPFTLEAGAPSDSLYVDDGGRLGLGTDNPVVDVHIVSGNTPTHRLEQNGSSGFTPQTWDVAGNEAGFFIRDATNGSTLPFRIAPSAPSSSIHIVGVGDVGVGTSSPGASLHVQRTDGSAQLRVEEASVTPATRHLLHLENNGQVQMVLHNSDSGRRWNMGLDEVDGQADSFVISRPGTGGPELSILTNGEIRLGAGASAGLKVAPNGNVEISGTLAQGSSRAIKDNIQRVNPRAILNRVAELPVAVWNYKTDDASVRHVGPMAEDFRAAFRLGNDSKHLAPSDVAGVALVAVQGLREVVEEKDQHIADLTSRIEQLECLVALLAEDAAKQTTHDGSKGTQP